MGWYRFCHRLVAVNNESRASQIGTTIQPRAGRPYNWLCAHSVAFDSGTKWNEPRIQTRAFIACTSRWTSPICSGSPQRLQHWKSRSQQVQPKQLDEVVPGAGIEPARGFPQGIFVPLQLSRLHARGHAFVVWTLPLPSRNRCSRPRIRQGPSSLYTFLGGAYTTTEANDDYYEQVSSSPVANDDNGDDRLENLRLLCPNCHALTPTYRSRRRTKA